MRRLGDVPITQLRWHHFRTAFTVDRRSYEGLGLLFVGLLYYGFVIMCWLGALFLLVRFVKWAWVF